MDAAGRPCLGNSSLGVWADFAPAFVRPLRRGDAAWRAAGSPAHLDRQPVLAGVCCGRLGRRRCRGGWRCRQQRCHVCAWHAKCGCHAGGGSSSHNNCHQRACSRVRRHAAGGSSSHNNSCHQRACSSGVRRHAGGGACPECTLRRRSASRMPPRSGCTTACRASLVPLASERLACMGGSAAAWGVLISGNLGRVHERLRRVCAA